MSETPLKQRRPITPEMQRLHKEMEEELTKMALKALNRARDPEWQKRETIREAEKNKLRKPLLEVFRAGKITYDEWFEANCEIDRKFPPEPL